MSIYYNHFGVIWILLILVQSGIGKTYYLLKKDFEDNPMSLGEGFSNEIILHSYPLIHQLTHYLMELIDIVIVALLFIYFGWVCSLLYIANAYIGRFIFYAFYTNSFFLGSFFISFSSFCNSKYVYLFYVRLILLSVITYNLLSIAKP